MKLFLLEPISTWQKWSLKSMHWITALLCLNPIDDFPCCPIQSEIYVHPVPVASKALLDLAPAHLSVPFLHLYYTMCRWYFWFLKAPHFLLFLSFQTDHPLKFPIMSVAKPLFFIALITTWSYWVNVSLCPVCDLGHPVYDYISSTWNVT